MVKCLMGPYNAGPKSALFLRVALILKAGVREAGVIRAILKREYHVLLLGKLIFFEIWYIGSLYGHVHECYQKLAFSL